MKRHEVEQVIATIRQLKRERDEAKEAVESFKAVNAKLRTEVAERHNEVEDLQRRIKLVRDEVQVRENNLERFRKDSAEATRLRYVAEKRLEEAKSRFADVMQKADEVISGVGGAFGEFCGEAKKKLEEAKEELRAQHKAAVQESDLL